MSEKIVQLNEEVIKGQLKQRQGYRSGHYNRNLMTTAGEVNYSAFATLGTHLGVHFIPIFSEGIFFVLYTKPTLYFALVTAT